MIYGLKLIRIQINYDLPKFFFFFYLSKNYFLHSHARYPIGFEGSGGPTLFERKKSLHNRMDRPFEVEYHHARWIIMNRQRNTILII